MNRGTKIRLSGVVLGLLGVVVGFQNCAKTNFALDSGSADSSSMSQMKLLGVHSEFETYQADHWQMMMANRKGVVRFESASPAASYDVVVTKASSDTTDISWAGCQIANLQAVPAADGSGDFELRLGDCVIPVEKISVEVVGKNASGVAIEGATAPVDVGHIHLRTVSGFRDWYYLHGNSGSASNIRSRYFGKVDTVETRAPTFTLEVPKQAHFLKLQVYRRNASGGREGAAICERQFSVQGSGDLAIQENYGVVRLPLGGYTDSLTKALNLYECAANAGQYVVRVMASPDNTFTNLAQDSDHRFQVIKGDKVLTHYGFSPTVAGPWIDAKQPSEFSSLRTDPVRVDISNKWNLTTGQCKIYLRIDRSKIPDLQSTDSIHAKMWDWGSSINSPFHEYSRVVASQGSIEVHEFYIDYSNWCGAGFNQASTYYRMIGYVYVTDSAGNVKFHSNEFNFRLTKDAIFGDGFED